MREAIHDMSLLEISFICAECSVKRDDLLYEYTDEQIYEQVYEKMCKIQAEEAHNASKRYWLASGVVNALGKELPKYQ